MRVVVTMLIAFAVAAGCKTRPATKAMPVAELSDESTATALVFDPPAVLYSQRLDLDRSGRDVGAFMGYREIRSETQYLRQDDRQVDYSRWPSVFERRAISERVGVTYR